MVLDKKAKPYTYLIQLL